MKWAPVLFGLLAVVLWEAAVRIGDVPVYLLPGPIAVLEAFAADPAGLLQALASTLFVTFSALLVAAVLGGRWRWRCRPAGWLRRRSSLGRWRCR